MFGFLNKKTPAPSDDDLQGYLKEEGVSDWAKVAGIHHGQDGQVFITLEVDPAQGAQLEEHRHALEKNINDAFRKFNINIVLTAERQVEAPPSNNQNSAPDPHGVGKIPRLENLPIKKIIAVASGKGGVGKSTIAANLAVSLAKSGQKVGVLDADIYGPSQPLLFGLQGQKPGGEDGALEPLETPDGIKVMSIGFMVDATRALIWRGPMVQTALIQLFRDVTWGSSDDPLDILIVDMPPGTGDAQLTLAQKIPVDGAIIVTTPQDLALADARKGLEMFRKTDVPIIGIIENMSTHICSECGHEEHIFGHGGAQKQAEECGVPYLGDIPLSLYMRESSDSGKPEGLPEDIITVILKGFSPEESLIDEK